MRVSVVSEVLQDVRLFPLPRLAPEYDGVFQLRGRCLPLLNFEKCFGSYSDNNESEIIIFLWPVSMGVRVPGELETAEIHLENLQQSGAVDQESIFLEGIVYEKKEYYHLISAEKLLQHSCELIQRFSAERSLDRKSDRSLTS